MGRTNREQETVLPPGFNVVFQRKIIFRSWNQAVCPGYVKSFFLPRVCGKSRGAGELIGEGKKSKLTLGCGSERMKGWRTLCCVVAPGILCGDIGRSQQFLRGLSLSCCTV